MNYDHVVKRLTTYIRENFMFVCSFILLPDFQHKGFEVIYKNYGNMTTPSYMITLLSGFMDLCGSGAVRL